MKWILRFIVVLSFFTLNARAEGLPKPGDKRYEPKLEYILSYNASLAPPEIIGPIAKGIRVNFYVTDGLFQGPILKARSVRSAAIG